MISNEKLRQINYSMIMKKTILIALSFWILQLNHAQDLPIQDTSKVVKVSKGLLKSYTGHYKLNDMAFRLEIILEQEQLYADVAGMGKIQLIPGSDNAFQAKEIQAQLEFISINGKVDKFKFYQGGDVIEAERTEAPPKLNYDKISVGDNRIDYSKVIAPFTAEWDLIIKDRKIGTATTSLRHAVFNGQSAYHGGSIIRYESMGNKPFADVGIFSKEDHRLLWARNAISQTDEITSVVNGTESTRYTIDINTGKISEQKTIDYQQFINGAGIQSLLAMEIKEGMTVQFPVSGFDEISWAKVLIKGKEEIYIESLDKKYNAWKLEYSTGTERWIIDEAPYLIKWKMPTGMLWELKSFID